MSDYSIWVLEYGYTSEFPKSVLLDGAHNEGTVKFSYAYVLIKGKNCVAMVDVGYDNVAYGRELNDRFGVENWHSPQDVLAGCGVTPEDVTHVFITHAHFDHLGAADLFPNATFYIQQQELAKWVWAMALDRRFRWLTAAIDPSDIIRAVSLARAGRLVSVEGVRENVLPGIDLYPAFDTHTPGSQYVLVRNGGTQGTSDGWILAGDLVYRFDNLTGVDENDVSYTPIGLATGSKTNLLLAMDEMVGKVGGDPKRVIPVHEARLKDVYPSRRSANGLHITELALGSGHTSCVR
jgi:glyoxylase-like metal-dependent hydrolase (beta-lactamase superfamily II)